MCVFPRHFVAPHHPQPIYLAYLHWLAIAELPTILDSFFTNNTSDYIGMITLYNCRLMENCVEDPTCILEIHSI